MSTAVSAEDTDTSREDNVGEEQIASTSSLTEDPSTVVVEGKEEVAPIGESDATPEDTVPNSSDVEVEPRATEQHSEEDMKPPRLSPEPPAASSTEPEDNTNTIMISAEDLAEAGLDMENLNELTEEQLNTLMTIAERRTQQEMGPPSVVTEENNDATESQNGSQFGGDSEDAPAAPNSDSITMVITDDGSLKLTDAIGQTFYFSCDQLSEMHIDVNNLTDESIQQIVQMAMPVISVGKNSSRPKNGEVSLFDHSMDMMQPGSSTIKQEVLRASQMIGEQVEIRKEGKPQMATIRYVRNGGSYKVQFEDGHFEWITDEQITLRTARRNDHESYHHDSSPLTGGAASRVLQAPLPVALKRSAGPPSQLNNACSAPKRSLLEPNFCCPICDNKVHQKEPAYIVIRIPACDSCTREKIIVLDDQGEEGAVMQ